MNNQSNREKTNDGEAKALFGPAPLPRLMYVGNVPVESTHHGSALLFRLLEQYPPNKLLIVESSNRISRVASRLHSVSYRSFPSGTDRLLHTRFGRYYATWLTMRAAAWSGLLSKVIGDFLPEAVLTAAHGPLWRSAAAFAEKHSLPLHLVCHDEVQDTTPVLEPIKFWLERKFGRAYRSAASRLCVSPYMRDSYEERFGVRGEVLYPCRAADAPRFQGVPERAGRQKGPFTVAFAGTVHPEALRDMADALAPLGGRLLIFCPEDQAKAIRGNLPDPHVVFRGMLPYRALLEALRAEADLLFVPMSFDPKHRANMSLSFPSKLADYTLTGLPMLVRGPGESSAVRWARENPGVAVVLDERAPTLLASTLRVLETDREQLVRLGLRALQVGEHCFSYANGKQKFFNAVKNGMKQIPTS